ncbi:MAG TPA: hypothetical protein VF384_13075 [Planctomycetota bacterium]
MQRSRAIAGKLLCTFVLAAPLTTQQPAQSEPPKQKPEFTAEQLASATAFANKFEQALRAGEIDACLAAWDRDAIAEAVCKGLQTDAKKLAEAKESARAGMDKSLPALFEHWKNDVPKAKRALVADGALLARFRFADEQGISIIDLELAPTADGWKVVDFHNRTLGVSYVEQARQTILPALASLDRGFLSRLFGSNAVKPKDLEACSKLASDQLKGDYQAVLAGYSKLPAALQDTGGVRSIYLGALGQAGDEKQYIAELERAAAQFPAPMFRFMLVDAYFLSKQWDKTIALLDEFIAAVEQDAALLTLRANVLLQAGRVAEALAVVREAQKLEPDCEYMHNAGLDVLLAAKEWKAVRASIEFLEKTGKFKFRGALEGEQWAEFRQQPESEPWR